MRTHLARCATLVILSFAGAACADSVPTTAPPAPLADISPAICGARANSTIDKLTSCVTSAAVSAHQAAFDGIATANGGARAAGTSGYDASAAYVAGALGGAGYAVTLQSFTFDDWVLVQSSLEQVSPFSTVYVRDTDYRRSANQPPAMSPPQ